MPLAGGGAALLFRGRQIRDGVEAALLAPGFGLAQATDVVVSGASAGALAVYLTLDRWRGGGRAAFAHQHIPCPAGSRRGQNLKGNPVTAERVSKLEKRVHRRFAGTED